MWIILTVAQEQFHGPGIFRMEFTYKKNKFEAIRLLVSLFLFFERESYPSEKEKMKIVSFFVIVWDCMPARVEVSSIQNGNGGRMRVKWRKNIQTGNFRIFKRVMNE